MMHIRLWILAALLAAGSAVTAPFEWFRPAALVIIGGKESVEPTAPPEILRAQCVEAALEMKRSFPGRQNAIGLFWSPPGNRLEDLPQHLAALKEGLRQAAEILGGPERLVFIGWVVSPEVLDEIEREVGIRTGTFGFEYWRWHATYSRTLADAGVGLRLNEDVAGESGDFVLNRLRQLSQAGRVTFDLVAHEGNGFGPARLFNAAGEPVWENFSDERVITAWEEATRRSGEYFGSAPAFAGVMLDEPILYLNDNGAPLHSPELAALFEARYGRPLPEFPASVADRQGPDFVLLDRFYRSLLNPFVERCAAALKAGDPGALAITPLVSVEYPWTGFDYLASPLDVVCCDPYAYTDFQIVHTQVEQQLYDDAAGVLGQGKVHILYPRRAAWKLMGRNDWQWEYGELVSWTRSFRRLTPLVNHITDDLAMERLEELSGILVWPVARVLSGAESERLGQWIRAGNVLVLSRATGFRDDFSPIADSDEPFLAEWLAGGDEAIHAPQEFRRIEWNPLLGQWGPQGDAPAGEAMLRGPGGAAYPQMLPLRPLRLREGKARVLAELPDGRPVAALHPTGQGLVIVALGAEAAPDYPTNIPVDPLLIAVARESLAWIGVPEAGKIDAEGEMLFFNADTDYLTVFASGEGWEREIRLNPDPAAWGTDRFEPCRPDGTPLPRTEDGYVLRLNPDRRYEVLRLRR